VFEDCVGERASAADELPGDPHLGCLLAAGELACEPVEPDHPVERAERHMQCRVELVQVPAQPLLRAAPFIDEIVAVVDQQLQLAQSLLTGARSVQPRLLECGAGDRQRVDRVRLPARPAVSALRRRQARRHPHQPLPGREQRLLESAGDVPTVLERPQPLLAERLSPGDDRLVDRPAVFGERAAELVDGDRAGRGRRSVRPRFRLPGGSRDDRPLGVLVRAPGSPGSGLRDISESAVPGLFGCWGVLVVEESGRRETLRRLYMQGDRGGLR
jgi:hypothetical protein